MTARVSSRSLSRFSTLASVASVLLAAGCSAPPGSDDGGGVPEFGGVAPSTAPTPGSSTPTGTAAGAPNLAPVTGAGGSTSAPNGEQVGAGGIGLTPTAPAPTAGAGGSSMVGAGTGAGGSSMAPVANAGGSVSMPPANGNPPPPPSPAPTANCGSAFLCDDFEGVAAGASPNPATWGIMDQYSERDASAAVLVSNANARTGSQALRVTPAGRAGILGTLPQSSYFLRAYMQIDDVTSGPVFIGAGTEANNETRFRIQGQSFATINSVGSPSSDAVRPADANSGNCADCVTLTANEWLCVELSIDSNASTATLWIDGVEAAVAGAEAFAPQPANPTLFLGTMDVQGRSTGVWIDDVVVAATRVGCD
jgi:hypothetical protein